MSFSSKRSWRLLKRAGRVPAGGQPPRWRFPAGQRGPSGECRTGSENGYCGAGRVIVQGVLIGNGPKAGQAGSLFLFREIGGTPGELPRDTPFGQCCRGRFFRIFSAAPFDRRFLTTFSDLGD